MSSNFTLKTCAALFTGMLAVASYGQTKPVKKFGPETQQYLKCASTEYEAYLKQKLPNRNSSQEFEQWLAPKVAAAKNQNLAKSTNSTNAVVTIPVVVHVIHNGDAIGVNENISEEQILSQIEVLNQDFRRMAGTPGFNTNPVGADMEIQFCLAQQDPDGLASTGIIRYNLGDNDGWEMNEAETNLKPQTQWDPTKYLNIWVVDFAYIDFGFFQAELAGYAQFPTGSGLDGLEDPSMPTLAETDGVVIGHLHFGSRDIYPEGTYDDETGKDRGRTTTHEVGHFFGLRHIWGDGDQGECNGNDFCTDTPAADAANQGCPTGTNSCPAPGNDMIENYMDYTTDLCQNIFTQDQKDRMVAVLANSPRRASLVTSLGCVPGLIYDNDGSLEINDLNLQDCANSFTPSLTLRNAGNNTLTSAVINYDIDGENAGTTTWNGSLDLNETTVVTLPLLSTTGGEHTLNVSIATVNGVEDGTEVNDVKSETFVIREFQTQQVKITIMTDYYGNETSWTLRDSDNSIVAQGGDYNDEQLYNQTVNVQEGECYTFEIEDTEGDGICCMYGEGYYRLRTADNTLIAEGGSFAFNDIVTFKILDDNMGTNDMERLLSNIALYPNPTNAILNIAMPNNELPEGYTIYNSIGQVMAAAKVTTAANLSINTSAYSNGIYFIKIEKGGQAQTLKFVKN